MPDLSQFDPAFQAAGQEWNVDPQLLKAMATQESAGNPRAVSSANAQGLMQIIPPTQKALGVTDPTDPVQSIYGGAKYMAQALDAEKTPEDALRYYHGGPNWRDNFGPESRAYVPAVTAHYQQLAQADSAAQSATSAPQGGPQAVPAPTAPDTAASPFDAALAAAKAGGGASDGAATAAASPFDAALAAAKTGSPDETTATPTTMQKIGAGLSRAAHDITDVPAELIARGASAIGLTGALNQAGIAAPTPEQTSAGDTNALAAYNRDYGDSTIAGAARVGGQIAGTLPILMAGGGIAGGAADIAAAGIGRAVPDLAPYAEGGAALLQGTLRASQPGALNLLARGSSLATQGALQGGAAGALLAGQAPDQSVGSQALQGAGVGALAGPVAGALGAGFNQIAGRAGGAVPEIAQLAQLARDKFGIPITAPQMTRNPLIRAVNEQSASLPFSGAGPAAAAQQTAWQRAVSHTIGEDTPLVTPEVMSRAARRIGGVFDDVAARTNVTADNQMLNSLGRIETEAAAAPLGAEGQTAIKSQIDNLINAAAKGNGTLTGDSYQQLIRAGSPLERAAQAADPNVRYYAQQIRDTLDGAFQRSASPADQAALGQARGQWRAMKTIEDLVEKSPDGNLSPALLMGQVRSASSRFDSSTGGMAYTGGGDLGDLARIGQLFLKQSPNSTTADRMAVNYLLGLGGVAGVAAQPWTIAGVPAGLAANRALGGYLRSGGFANRVIGSSLNPPAAASRFVPIAAPTAVAGYNALQGPQGGR